MKKVRGSATVEMAYMMPMVFFTFIICIYILFYLHDKNIINGAGYETLVVGCQKLRWQEENPEEKITEIFRERVKGKLIFFSEVDVKVTCEKEMIVLKLNAKKKRMEIRIEQKRKVIRPENSIRNLRRLHGNKI